MSQPPLPPEISKDVAEILGEIAKEIEQLGGALCSDPATAAAHSEDLQAIDLIAQKICDLAAMIAAESPEEGLQRMRLDRLRERFTALKKNS